jgi:hypothetical protein
MARVAWSAYSSARMRRLPFVLVLAALAAGCSGGEEDAAAPRADRYGWTTQAEKAWLRDLRAWSDGLDAAIDDAIEVEDDDARLDAVLAEAGEERRVYLRALGPFERCSVSLRGDVGPPPSGRIARVRDDLLVACESMEQHVRTIHRGLALGETDVIDRANDVFNVGWHRLDAVLKGLPPAQARPLARLRGVTTRSRIEPELSRVASRLAGKRAEVRCWSVEDWSRLLDDLAAVDGEDQGNSLGFAVAGGKRIQLAPVTCTRLVNLRYHRQRPTSADLRLELALGAGTLAHESAHASGVSSEARAECYSVQLLERAAWALGVRPAYARTLVEAYWEDYPANPPEYRSGECRDGGEFDMRPNTDEFP